jgi:alginate O-acetyltransferase complex protein AlgI
VFRAESVTTALEIYKGMLGMHGMPPSAFGEFAVPYRKPEFFQTLLLGLFICLALPPTIALERWVPGPIALVGRPRSMRMATALIAAFTVVLFGMCVSQLGVYSPFLYFQF